MEGNEGCERCSIAGIPFFSPFGEEEAAPGQLSHSDWHVEMGKILGREWSALNPNDFYDFYWDFKWPHPPKKWVDYGIVTTQMM